VSRLEFFEHHQDPSGKNKKIKKAQPNDVMKVENFHKEKEYNKTSRDLNTIVLSQPIGIFK
jgi:hypothetical protein